jgi:biopolymer transport protein ExbD
MPDATRFVRYRLRSLLILTTVIAIVLGFARLRPSSTIPVNIQADGSIAIAGLPVAPQALQQRLETELADRRRWFVDGTVVVQADREAKFQSLSAVVQAARLAGSSQIAITAQDIPKPATQPQPTIQP